MYLASHLFSPKHFFAFIVTLFLSACGTSDNSASRALGTASEDGNVHWLKAQFSKATPIKKFDELKPTTYWICRQRSAIRNSTHRSEFWQMWFQRGAEYVSETTFFIDQREKMIGLFGVNQFGTHGSTFGYTDRYEVPHDMLKMFVRKTTSGQLIMEWTVPLCATITGRNFSFVPEVVGQCPLMDRSVSAPNEGAMIYALCDQEKPIKVDTNLDLSHCDDETGMCTMFTVTVNKHTPNAPVGTYTGRRFLAYGTVQQAYGETLEVTTGTCTRSVALEKSMFKVVAQVVETAQRAGEGHLTESQKGLLEFYRTLRKKAEDVSCFVGAP